MKYLFSVLILAYSLNFIGQDYVEEDTTKQSTYNLMDHLYFEGGIALNFGDATVLGGTPSVGYKITDNLSAGIGGTIYYQKFIGNDPFFYYGGNLFAKYLILNNLFVQSEYHLLNVEVYDSILTGTESKRTTIPMFFVGGGYRQPLGANSYLAVRVMWDVIDHEQSPFINPFISGGISIGL